MESLEHMQQSTYLLKIPNLLGIWLKLALQQITNLIPNNFSFPNPWFSVLKNSYSLPVTNLSSRSNFLWIWLQNKTTPAPRFCVFRSKTKPQQNLRFKTKPPPLLVMMPTTSGFLFNGIQPFGISQEASWNGNRLRSEVDMNESGSLPEEG